MKLAAILVLGMLLAACAAKEPVVSFRTPSETFETWRNSAVRLDLDTLLDSYATHARSQMENELARTNQDSLRSMQRETQRTRFTVERVIFEDNRAFLRIRRRYGGVDDIEVITMVREGSGWKILP